MSAPVIVVPVDYLEDLVSTLMAAQASLLEYADGLSNADERQDAIHNATLAREVRQFADDLEDEDTFPRLSIGVPA